MHDGQHTLALETAERYKNRCLTWILDEWKEHVTSPSYAEIQALLNDSTAVVYWHLSGDRLTTFILRKGSTEPILVGQTNAFQAWLKEWKTDYTDYRDKKKAAKTKAGHAWRTELQSRLNQLSAILDISAIERQLPSSIQNLILIPHQDLHCLPLHILFSRSFTTTFLPSLQIGLTLKQRLTSRHPFLLIVEDPSRDDVEPMRFAKLEAAIASALFPNAQKIDSDQCDRATLETALNTHHGIFHFTGHGTYNDRQPENSEIGLRGTDRFTAKEIHTLDLGRCIGKNDLSQTRNLLMLEIVDQQAHRRSQHLR